MNRILRMLALLMAVMTVLLTVSCQNNAQDPQNALTEQRLTVEKVPVRYTEQETETFSARLTELCLDFVPYFSDFLPGENRISKIKEGLLEKTLPMLQNEGVTATELDIFCTKAKAIFEEHHTHPLTREHRVSLLSDIYLEGILLLGAERMGSLAYESILLWLQGRIDTCMHRYQTYGYAFYLHDADTYRAERAEFMEKIGKNTFISMTEAIFFGGNLLGVMSQEMLGNTQAAVLNNAELLLLLQKHASTLQTEMPNQEHWVLGATLFHSWISVDTLMGTAWTSYQKDALKTYLTPQIAAGYGSAFSNALSFYSEMVSHLSEDDIEIFRGNDENLKKRVLCQAMASCGEKFENFISESAQLLYSATEEEKMLLQKHGMQEAYDVFAADITSIEAQSWCAAVRAYANDPTAQNFDALEESTQGFLFRICPYLTFAFAQEGGI